VKEAGEQRGEDDHTHGRGAHQGGSEQHQQVYHTQSPGSGQTHRNAERSQPHDMDVSSVMGEDKGIAWGGSGGWPSSRPVALSLAECMGMTRKVVFRPACGDDGVEPKGGILIAAMDFSFLCLAQGRVSRLVRSGARAGTAARPRLSQRQTSRRALRRRFGD
jgi:hypothetical protein